MGWFYIHRRLDWSSEFLPPSSGVHILFQRSCFVCVSCLNMAPRATYIHIISLVSEHLKPLLSLAFYHNVALSLFSGAIFFATTYIMAVEGHFSSFEDIVCRPITHPHFETISFLFLLSKVWEWFDTVLLIAKGKRYSLFSIFSSSPCPCPFPCPSSLSLSFSFFSCPTHMTQHCEPAFRTPLFLYLVKNKSTQLSLSRSSLPFGMLWRNRIGSLYFMRFIT
jgi:hypothetical protein